MPPPHQRLVALTSLVAVIVVLGAALAFGWPGAALPMWGSATLSLGLCAPLFVATALEFRRQRPIWQQLVPEGLALLGAAVPLLNGFAVLIILVLLNLLPRFATHPPPTNDALFQQPNDWVTVLVLAVAGFSAWEIWLRRGGWGPMAERLTVSTRRLTLLLALCATVLLAWPLNDFTGAWLFSTAALLWPWIEPRTVPAGRALNIMLALGGVLPFIAACVALAGEVGPFWWWYLLMGAAYGVYSLPMMLAFVLGAALFARFLRRGTRPTPDSLSR
ncbi:MAG: hypothetical protein ACT4QE_06615 [Anaerolineales bacterium]